LAPELRDGGIITRSADLYSLGVIIIEILTGQKGYQATEDVRITHAIVTKINGQYIFFWLKRVNFKAIGVLLVRILFKIIFRSTHSSGTLPFSTGKT
jgi:serine/threonine protein kinase